MWAVLELLKRGVHEFVTMQCSIYVFINPGNSSCGGVTCKHKHRPADFGRWFVYETLVDHTVHVLYLSFCWHIFN